VVKTVGVKFELDLHGLIDDRVTAWIVSDRPELQVTWFQNTIFVWDQNLLTRSQAVARIADHTAKNCMGHVT